MSNQSSILIIFTGGTIGMIKKVDSYVPINFNELIKYFPELDKLNYYLEIIGFNPPIDSAEMSPKIWTKIVEIIEKITLSSMDSLFYMVLIQWLILLQLLVSCFKI